MHQNSNPFLSEVENLNPLFARARFDRGLHLLNDEHPIHELSAETDMSIFFVPASWLVERIDVDLATGSAIARDLARRLKIMRDGYIEALTVSAKDRICGSKLRKF